ncbi:uncharacterized protein CCDC7 isoform X2 [Anomaloglossus baeobatrachus]|uniref:uncharacterized protein CCDC7 isoform X2 n=1 Tax=Anomaloglossus baeobatrachus TaxID=238106 RepID=UPI003F509BF9
MATAAIVKTPNTTRPKPSFTPRKTTHLTPIKRKIFKTAAEEYLPMELQPPPEAESVLKYAISLTGSGWMGNFDNSVNEMRQICKNLDEYTKDLENVYEKGNEKVTAQTSYMEPQFFSFLSTCDSATRELDTAINVEHKILESLYQDYQEEAQLLEELGEEDISADRDIRATHDKVTALICKLMEILYKHSFKSLPKTGKTRGRAEIQGSDLKSDQRQQIESLIRALRELMANTDKRSKEGMERIIHDVDQLFAAQAIELHKLGKDQEETENKYITVKTNYQVLLQEKRFLETELRKLLAWRAAQKSPPMLTPGLEEILEEDYNHIPSIVTDSDITYDYRSDQELEIVTKLIRSQEKAKLQGDVSPADSPVSSRHKKTKIQKEGDTGFSETEYTYELDQGNLCTSPTTEARDGDMVETKINGGPESNNEFSSINSKDLTTGNEKKVKGKKQKVKSLKRKGRRPNAASSKAKMADQDDRKSRKTTIEKAEDKPENEKKQVPEMVYNLKKSVTKLPRTPSASGKGKVKLGEGDALTAMRPGVQSHGGMDSDPHGQQMRPHGPEPSRSVGIQINRRQSLRSKARHQSEEKLEGDKESQKDPGKLQIAKEKPINQNVHESRFHDQSVVLTEGSRGIYSGPGLSRTSPDQESLSKDVLDPDRGEKIVRSGTEDTDVSTQYSGVGYSTGEGQVLEDTLSSSYQDSKKTFLSTDSAFTQIDPSGAFHTSGKMDFPDQTAVQVSSDDDDPMKASQRSQPSPAAFSPYPPPHPTIQMPEKADKAKAQSGNQLQPAMKFGDDAGKQYRQTTGKYEAADLILLGQSIGPQTQMAKFQRDQVWQDLDDGFHEFPQSFESELCIQGRSFSVKHSTENSSRTPSPGRSKQRGERRKLLYRKRATRNVPSEHSILSTLTVKGIGRGVTSADTPSEKMNANMFKEGPQKNPDQTWTLCS